MRLREFRLDDYDAVMALWQNAGPGIGISRSDGKEEIRKKLLRDPDLFLLAEEEGRIIGSVIGGFDGRRGIIYHLAVEDSYRRQGIGKRLMDEVERRLAAKGCLRCYLLVKKDAPEVIEFYDRLGWEILDLDVLAKNIA
ncbi:MAG: GNAT family acetyltransferase [Chloroflexi bacterium]|nr:GNAT family acetyltransferase [Chloroflexota bacterium]